MHCITCLWDHNTCNILWCQIHKNPTEYTHDELPYGKDLHGSSLQHGLQDLFCEYASPTVALKLAPCLDPQRNESLNGNIGSKNHKVRRYRGSERSLWSCPEKWRPQFHVRNIKCDWHKPWAPLNKLSTKTKLEGFSWQKKKIHNEDQHKEKTASLQEVSMNG